MPYYRLYFLELYSSHIEHVREFEADGDEAAIAQCEAWREGSPMELWARSRKVRRWEAAGPVPVGAPPGG